MNRFLIMMCLLLSLTPGLAAERNPELHPEKSQQENRLANTFPPGVRTIACISPAWYPASEYQRRGVELLKKSGCRIKVMPHAFDRPPKGQRSAPLESRLEDFYAAWNDPEVDMIICIQGGRGSADLLAALDWKKLKKRDNLFFQGYSDITLITAALLARGYGRPVGGPLVGTLVGLQQDSIEEMRAMHHGEQVGPVPVEKMKGGDCSGLAFTGLLSRLATASRTDYCPSMAGRIVFIESVTSSPENMRKDFQTLLDRKFFDGASGVVFCHFSRCGSQAEVDALLKEFASQLSVPVYRGFPFGHLPDIYTIDFSRLVEIKDSRLTFPAVKGPEK